MFLPVLHHHMRFCSNPFSMGFMAMNPRINFFMGMAAATSMPMVMPMVYPMPMFGNPFMNSVFSTPNFVLYNFGNITNPFINSIPSYNFSSFNLPAANFSYNASAAGFGTLASASSVLNKQDKRDNETSNNTSYASSSKLKPGLLKGNLVGKEAVITQLCEKYGVDLALVVSIIGQESGFGTSNLAQHNNFMGYRAAGDCGKSAKGFGYFSTPEKGLEAGIRNLSKYPERYASVKKADMNNIDAIGKIYCEGDTYASAIKNLYNTTVRGYLA